ncbi:hypothetical protein C8J57DRAFT_1241296 [Mycena rebaudengoi]|nr:hypothetical protein C8J57DRAFT_1241296 [Mycena rebaudengoi]
MIISKTCVGVEVRPARHGDFGVLTRTTSTPKADFNNSDAAAPQNNPAPHCQVFLKHDGIPIEFPRLCKSFLAVWYWLYIIWQRIARRGTLHSCNIPDVTALSDATVYSDWAGDDLDLAWAPTVDAERSSVSPYTSFPNSRCIVHRRDGLVEGINTDSLLYLDICFTSRARAPVSHDILYVHDLGNPQSSILRAVWDEGCSQRRASQIRWLKLRDMAQEQHLANGFHANGCTVTVARQHPSRQGHELNAQRRHRPVRETRADAGSKKGGIDAGSRRWNPKARLKTRWVRGAAKERGSVGT